MLGKQRSACAPLSLVVGGPNCQQWGVPPFPMLAPGELPMEECLARYSDSCHQADSPQHSHLLNTPWLIAEERHREFMESLMQAEEQSETATPVR